MGKKVTTNRDMQRVLFVENLEKSLRQAEQALKKNDRFLELASEYIQCGLSQEESVELLIGEGLHREAAENCVNCIMDDVDSLQFDDNSHEYSFQFEDGYGKIWSSFDIGKTVFASNDEDAFVLASEIILGSNDQDIELERIVSVNRIS